MQQLYTGNSNGDGQQQQQQQQQQHQFFQEAHNSQQTQQQQQQQYEHSNNNSMSGGRVREQPKRQVPEYQQAMADASYKSTSSGGFHGWSHDEVFVPGQQHSQHSQQQQQHHNYQRSSIPTSPGTGHVNINNGFADASTEANASTLFALPSQQNNNNNNNHNTQQQQNQNHNQNHNQQPQNYTANSSYNAAWGGGSVSNTVAVPDSSYGGSQSQGGQLGASKSQGSMPRPPQSQLQRHFQQQQQQSPGQQTGLSPGYSHSNEGGDNLAQKPQQQQQLQQQQQQPAGLDAFGEDEEDEYEGSNPQPAEIPESAQAGEDCYFSEEGGQVVPSANPTEPKQADNGAQSSNNVPLQQAAAVGQQDTAGGAAPEDGDPDAPNLSLRNLFISGLPSSICDVELRAMFEAHGPVTSAKVMLNIRTGVSRGFGFVMYDSPEDAKAGMKGFHGQILHGSTTKLKINYSEHKGQNLKVKSKKLYVRNIPSVSHLLPKELLDFFGSFGEITELQCRNDPYQTPVTVKVVPLPVVPTEVAVAPADANMAASDGSDSPTGPPSVVVGFPTATVTLGTDEQQEEKERDVAKATSPPLPNRGADEAAVQANESRREEWEACLIPSGKTGQTAMRVLFVEFSTCEVAKRCVDAAHNSMPFTSCATPLLAKIFEPQDLREQRLKEQSDIKQKNHRGQGQGQGGQQHAGVGLKQQQHPPYQRFNPNAYLGNLSPSPFSVPPSLMPSVGLASRHHGAGPSSAGFAPPPFGATGTSQGGGAPSSGSGGNMFQFQQQQMIAVQHQHHQQQGANSQYQQQQHQQPQTAYYAQQQPRPDSVYQQQQQQAAAMQQQQQLTAQAPQQQTTSYYPQQQQHQSPAAPDHQQQLLNFSQAQQNLQAPATGATQQHNFLSNGEQQHQFAQYQQQQHHGGASNGYAAGQQQQQQQGVGTQLSSY